MVPLHLSESLRARGSVLQRCWPTICRSRPRPASTSSSSSSSSSRPAHSHGACAPPGPRPARSLLSSLASRPPQGPAQRVQAAAYTGSASPTAPGPRVCILGGGFGGLYTAVKLESLLWPKGNKPQVTLIDQSERFVFKPLLYELLNGLALPDEVAPTFAQLLAPYPVQFVQERVQGVEPDALLRDGGSAAGGSVVLGDGRRLQYDWLVVALGAEPDARGVPGVKEHARPFATLEDAVWLNERLAELEGSSAAGEVVVVGGGYSGVELAAVLGERLLGGSGAGRCRVTLVTPGSGVLEGSDEAQREAAAQALAKVNVEVRTNTRVSRLTPPVTSSSEATPSGTSSANSEHSPAASASGGGGSAQPRPGHCLAYLEPCSSSSSSSSSHDAPNGSVIEADVVLWTAGATPVSGLLQGLPFPSTPRGALQTDPTLQVHGHTRVFALGDVAGGVAGAGAAQGYPATAQVAFQQADYAAWNIWAAINGRPLLPFRYQHLGNMVSLGAANAAVSVPLAVPEQLAAAITGSPLGPLLSLAGVRLGGGVVLEGPLAQLLRRAAYLYRQPTNEQRLSVAAGWVQQAASLSAALGRGLAQGGGAGFGGSSSKRGE